MSCDRFAELLGDYCEQRLSSKDMAFAREHAEMCSACRADAEMWRKLASLPQAEPDPNGRARFNAMLAAYEEGRWEKSSLARERQGWWQTWFHGVFAAPLAQATLATLFILVGFVVGEHFSTRPVETQQLASLQSEVTNLRQTVALSLMEQQSASRRLEGVSYSTRLSRPDPEITAALLHALNFDSSVDVRLSALDALRRYETDPHVRSGLIAALRNQQSPLVQIALIDLFVEMRESDAKDNLRQMQQDNKINPTVRQRAQWGIEQLS